MTAQTNAAHDGRIPRDGSPSFPTGRGAGFYTQQGQYAVKGCRISETEHPMGGGVPAVGAAHRTGARGQLFGLVMPHGGAVARLAPALSCLPFATNWPGGVLPSGRFHWGANNGTA